MDNNLSEYKMLIGCGFILGYSIYYIIKRNNYFQQPTRNMEPFTYEEMEDVFNENMVDASNNANLEELISDNDYVGYDLGVIIIRDYIKLLSLIIVTFFIEV